MLNWKGTNPKALFGRERRASLRLLLGLQLPPSSWEWLLGVKLSNFSAFRHLTDR
jgi:hypothetical protein